MEKNKPAKKESLQKSTQKLLRKHSQKQAQNIRVLNVRLPDESLRWIDDLVKNGIYNSRSEAIRTFIREDLEQVKQ